MTAPWLTKKELAAHLGASVRSIENATAEGMPHAKIFGRVKYQPDEVEAWLEDTGRMRRRRWLRKPTLKRDWWKVIA